MIDAEIRTRHAQARGQQRCVAHSVVDLLFEYGRLSRHRAADVYFFGRKERARLARSMPRPVLTKVERKLNCYIVVGDDGRVITCGHRTRRLWRR